MKGTPLMKCLLYVFSLRPLVASGVNPTKRTRKQVGDGEPHKRRLRAEAPALASAAGPGRTPPHSTRLRSPHCVRTSVS